MICNTQHFRFTVTRITMQNSRRFYLCMWVLVFTKTQLGIRRGKLIIITKIILPSIPSLFHTKATSKMRNCMNGTLTSYSSYYAKNKSMNIKLLMARLNRPSNMKATFCVSCKSFPKSPHLHSRNSIVNLKYL